MGDGLTASYGDHPKAEAADLVIFWSRFTVLPRCQTAALKVTNFESVKGRTNTIRF